MSPAQGMEITLDRPTAAHAYAKQAANQTACVYGFAQSSHAGRGS